MNKSKGENVYQPLSGTTTASGKTALVRTHIYVHINIYTPILTLLYIDCSQGTYGRVYFTTDQC
jgi:hypothetical protein